MTNASIILAERFRLMKQGIIKGTGEIVTVEENGVKKQVEMPEKIHTYNAWKSMGFQVQKGEKAVAQFTIWKYKNSKTDEETGEQDSGRMFMKKSSFFTARQVKKI